MKTHLTGFIAVSVMAFALTAPAATFYVDANSANPTFPYSGWDTAATNIQDAIDASADGDQIWVTNGVYQFGGQVMAGDLTNRVALNKAVTVQSVNGPFVTIIQGAGATNGTAAVRCAWLTNNATLVGFTLKWGATRTGGDGTLRNGGGVWCASSNSTVANCVIVSNTANGTPGGVYQGTLNNCVVSFNAGAGAYNVALNNCTVISNTFGVAGIGYGVSATNSIIYSNAGENILGILGSTFSHCCTIPAVTGSGNFTNAPQLFADGVHLTSSSPCIGAGANVATGTDIFGKTWANPPSVGCAEFDPSPLVTKPQIQLTSDPVGFTVGNLVVAGQTPFTFQWLKDGAPLQDNGHFSSTQTTNLVATGVSFADAGGYQLVVSNASGVVTSAVAQLVIHCVDVAGTNPMSPYTNWATAATNIQDAITAASAGEIVLVTNGLYATGGKSMDHVITNRVSVDKAIIVQSVNGPNATTIQGAWDPVSTNGPGAVRCVWLTNNAVLGGFTLRGGGTQRGNSDSANGGGVWGPLTNQTLSGTVANCIITRNAAANFGGGGYGVTFNNCTVANNFMPMYSGGSGLGGGAYGCNLKNCTVTSNSASSSGGGTAYGQLKNCAVTGNSAVQEAGGVYYGTLVNCTVTRNSVTGSGYDYGGGASFASLTNCIV